MKLNTVFDRLFDYVEVSYFNVYRPSNERELRSVSPLFPKCKEILLMFDHLYVQTFI